MAKLEARDRQEPSSLNSLSYYQSSQKYQLSQAAIEDMKRATDAMKAAEDKVAAIGDRMEEEERRLQV